MRPLATIVLILLVALPALIATTGATRTSPDLPLMSDGATPSLHPDGFLVTLPPGYPLVIKKREMGVDVVPIERQDHVRGARASDIERTLPPIQPPEEGAGTRDHIGGCTRHHAGYLQDIDNAYNENTGASVDLKVQNLPTSPIADLCNDEDLSWWVMQPWSDGAYIQAGFIQFESHAGTVREFCEWRTSSAGTPNVFAGTSYLGNNALYGFVIVRGSNGEWRAYSADLNSGAVSYDMGCGLSKGYSDGRGAQYLAEITGTSSSSTEMTRLRFDDLQVKILTQWRRPTSLTAAYNSATCPPYTADTIVGYVYSPGTTGTCVAGDYQYPAP